MACLNLMMVHAKLKYNALAQGIRTIKLLPSTKIAMVINLFKKERKKHKKQR